MSGINFNQLNDKFGDYVAQKRKSLGLTQHALAEKADVSRNTIAKLETLGTSIAFETALRLLSALQVSIQDFTETLESGGVEERLSGEIGNELAKDIMKALESSIEQS